MVEIDWRSAHYYFQRILRSKETTTGPRPRPNTSRGRIPILSDAGGDPSGKLAGAV